MTFSKRISVRQKSATRDSYGQPLDTWTEILETFAKIEPVNGKEFIQGNAQQSETTHTIMTRYNALIKPTQRVHWCNHIFEIMYIINPVLSYKPSTIYVKEVFVDE